MCVLAMTRRSAASQPISFEPGQQRVLWHAGCASIDQCPAGRVDQVAADETAVLEWCRDLVHARTDLPGELEHWSSWCFYRVGRRLVGDWRHHAGLERCWRRDSPPRG